MPNKRNKDKCGISVYVPSKIKDALTEADRRSVHMSELVTDIYREKLGDLGYDVSDVENSDD